MPRRFASHTAWSSPRSPSSRKPSCGLLPDRRRVLRIVETPDARDGQRQADQIVQHLAHRLQRLSGPDPAARRTAAAAGSRGWCPSSGTASPNRAAAPRRRARRSPRSAAAAGSRCSRSRRSRPGSAARPRGGRRRRPPASGHDSRQDRASAPARQRRTSEQRPPQDDRRGREVDDQAEHVDQRGDERRRRAGGVEPEAAQDERQHRPRKRPPQHDARAS